MGRGKVFSNFNDKIWHLTPIDKPSRLWFTFFRCSRNPVSFLKPGAGEPNSSEMGTGRTRPGNRFQGHFQGQARQLISQAFGRASLWIAKSAIIKFTPM